MKAIVQDRYGDTDTLEFRAIDQPVPAADQVLVRVHAAGLHRGDCPDRRRRLPLGLGAISAGHPE